MMWPICFTYRKTAALLYAWLLIGFVCACDREEVKPEQETQREYSFFVAGHVYGTPGLEQTGIYPLFVNNFELINTDTLIRFGILPGDITKEGLPEEWNAVEDDLSFLNCTTYFVAGNHDMKNRELFEERYGRTYYSFRCNNDIFIVLDPNIDNWNISGKQLEFLEGVIINQDSQIRNIFVCFHQLLWWDEDNIYSKIKPNSFSGRADTINFWTEIEPVFHDLSPDISVYMFAGDVGAAYWSADYMYHHYDNITFIATGMGEGEGDNFVIADVYDDGTVDFRLIFLNGEPPGYPGDLEDFVLP